MWGLHASVGGRYPMELYHNNMSVCAQKVRLVLAEKGLKPVEHHKTLRNGDTRTPEYLRLSPKGVVPVLVDEGTVILESTVICEYLEDKYPQVPMRPADPAAAARMRLWTQLVDVSVHQACAIVSVGVAWRHQMLASGSAQLRNRPAGLIKTIPDVVARGLQSPHFPEAVQTYDRLIANMAATLKSDPWLAGQTYSLADAALLPYVLRLSHLAMEWIWDGERGAVGDWLRRAQERPNYTAIADYLDGSYVALAQAEGQKVQSAICAMVSAG